MSILYISLLHLTFIVKMMNLSVQSLYISLLHLVFIYTVLIIYYLLKLQNYRIKRTVRRNTIVHRTEGKIIVHMAILALQLI